LYYAALASESDPFDAMEKAILEAYHKNAAKDEQVADAMIHEYPLDGKPPMMTHIYVQNGINIVAGKGAAERIIGICKLTQTETEVVWKQVKLLASKGYRVIGVANAVHSGNSFPGSQDDFDWQFLGLLGLYDPPRKNIPEVIKQFYNAKINVKILTGDHHQTATHIAGQIGISNCNKFITGDEVMALDDKELNETIKYFCPHVP
jgi:Ca2+-transporting ATPase